MHGGGRRTVRIGAEVAVPMPSIDASGAEVRRVSLVPETADVDVRSRHGRAEVRSDAQSQHDGRCGRAEHGEGGLSERLVSLLGGGDDDDSGDHCHGGDDCQRCSSGLIRRRESEQPGDDSSDDEREQHHSCPGPSMDGWLLHDVNLQGSVEGLPPVYFDSCGVLWHH